jgi:hypothetical protein
LKKKLADTEKENRLLLERTLRQEQGLLEQRTYITNLIEKQIVDDEILFQENDGGGPRSKNYKYGAVLKNIEEYHHQLTMDCQKSADEIREQIENGYMQQQVKEMVKGRVTEEFKSRVVARGDSQHSVVSQAESKQSSQLSRFAQQFRNSSGMKHIQDVVNKQESGSYATKPG